MKLIALVIGMMMVLCSCTKEEDVVPYIPQQVGDTAVFNLSFDIPSLGISVVGMPPTGVSPMTQYSYETRKNEEFGLCAVWVTDEFKLNVYYSYGDTIPDQYNGVIYGHGDSFVYNATNHWFGICNAPGVAGFIDIFYDGTPDIN